jgi:hypothetical protein
MDEEEESTSQLNEPEESKNWSQRQPVLRRWMERMKIEVTKVVDEAGRPDGLLYVRRGG